MLNAELSDLCEGRVCLPSVNRVNFLILLKGGMVLNSGNGFGFCTGRNIA